MEMNYLNTFMSFVIGVITGIISTFLGTRWIDKARKKEIKKKDKKNFKSALIRMPELINEMREDLGSEDWLCFEFIILPRVSTTYNTRSVKVFRYYEDEHPNLLQLIKLLEEYGFVSEITFNNTPRYKFELNFIELLKNWKPN